MRPALLLIFATIFLFTTLGLAMQGRPSTGRDEPADAEDRPSLADIDLNDIWTEILRTNVYGDATEMVFWLPQPTFVHDMMEAHAMPQAEAEEAVAFMEPYIYVLLQASETQPDGTEAYVAADTLGERVTVQVEGRDPVEPIDYDDLPDDVREYAEAWDEIMADDGWIGYVFPAPEGGLDIYEGGQFRVHLAEQDLFEPHTFVFDLPLSVFTREAQCDDCDRFINPAYRFCPWCGNAMAEK